MTEEMKNKEMLSEGEAGKAAGGNGYPKGELHLAAPKVAAGTYLAIRSDPSWNESNELAAIYPGNRFYVDVRKVAQGSGYNYFYADYNGTWGWVNASYLTLLD